MRRVALLALLLAGCGPAVPPNAVKACQDLAISEDRTDILFVVDDSGSMEDEQQNLAANFDAFIERLAASPAKNAYQVAVITTDVNRYDFGRFPDTFIASAACQGSPMIGQTYPKGAIVSV